MVHCHELAPNQNICIHFDNNIEDHIVLFKIQLNIHVSFCVKPASLYNLDLLELACAVAPGGAFVRACFPA